MTRQKAIIYARFSPRPNAAECHSIEYQLDRCRNYAETRGWEIVGEYRDANASGGEVEREGLWQAIDATRRDYILLVDRLDRLSRSVYLSVDIDRIMEKKKAVGKRRR